MTDRQIRITALLSVLFLLVVTYVAFNIHQSRLTADIGSGNGCTLVDGWTKPKVC